MTTYVYETIPERPGEEPTYLEVKQSMQDHALTHHPESGKPVRRVILGGIGVLTKTDAAPSAGGSVCGCEPGGCC